MEFAGGCVPLIVCGPSSYCAGSVQFALAVAATVAVAVAFALTATVAASSLRWRRLYCVGGAFIFNLSLLVRSCSAVLLLFSCGCVCFPCWDKVVCALLSLARFV